jgi:glucose-1-phosphate adenylyltransferase
MRSTINNASKTLVLIVPAEGNNLYPLTRNRPQPLVSFGAEFRIIDFTLWNCSNSGFRKVFVLPDRQAGAVAQYLDSLDWDGELISVYPDSFRRYRGTADALVQNLGLLQLEAPNYVLVLLTDHIYEMDYAKMLQFHACHGGDITVANDGIADIGVYLFDASAFRKALLREALAASSHGLNRYVIFRDTDELNIRGYDFRTHARASSTYWGSVDGPDCYYRTQFRFCGRQGGSDCLISPSVKIASTARMRSSIVLTGAEIGSGAHIRKAIIDENVRIQDGTTIGFNDKEDRHRFVVSKDGVVIVDHESLARLPDKTSTVILPRARTA